jgi:hypothetical protein
MNEWDLYLYMYYTMSVVYGVEGVDRSTGFLAFFGTRAH